MQFQVDFHFFFIKFSFLIFLVIRTKKFSETTRSVSLVKADKNETVDTEKVWKRLGILNIYILLYVLKCVKIC